MGAIPASLIRVDPTSSPPVALSIAGSDNSAGAGLQADLKAFGAFGVYGLTAVTCVVAEVPGRVSRIQPVDPGVVAEQLRLSLKAYPVAAVKTGMLYSESIIEAVCDALEVARIPFLTVDPVMVATSGDALLEADAVAAYQTRLFPMADLITPNMDEAKALTGREVDSVEAMREAALTLFEKHGAGVLLKGGHLRGGQAIDVLVWNGQVTELTAPHVEGIYTHGTGCTYSAAITAGIALGLELPEAVRRAKRFVTAAIREHFEWRRDTGVTQALNHITVRPE